MSLTPKNWATFQHYKDRSPVWIKLHRSLLDDYAFSRLPVDSRALAPLLWLLASEYEGGVIAASLDEIAYRLRMPLDQLERAVKPLVDAGFFSASEPIAERKPKAIPEKEIQEREEKEEESRAVAGATRTDREEPFEEFWKAYPKREGANPKKPAKGIFLAKLKAGATAAEIIAGAKACAIRDRDKIGTPYIPQAVKWLRDERWRDYAEQPSAAGSPSPGWRPGLPTTEELRAKYSREHDEQGKGIRLEQGASVDAGGPRLRGDESDVPRDRPGIGGTQKLGEILPRLGLDAAELPPVRARPTREVDSASPVAGMADDRHEGA